MILGCFDGSLHGWSVDASASGNAKLRLDFAIKAHLSCTKALACVRGRHTKKGKQTPTLLVSGGRDETINVFDLARQKQVNELHFHQESVSALAFVNHEFLLSGSVDGNLVLWRVAGWELVKELKGHKAGPVTSLGVHPSGTLAISTSRDNSLRMWDLQEGRGASRMLLSAFKELGAVQWDRKGKSYGLVADDKTVLVFHVANSTGEADLRVDHNRRVNALQFCRLRDGSRVLATASDDGVLRFFHLETGEILHQVDCGDGRLRTLNLASICSFDHEYKGALFDLCVVGTSKGGVQIWDVEKTHSKLLCKAQCRSSAHVVCALFRDSLEACDAELKTSVGDQDEVHESEGSEEKDKLKRKTRAKKSAVVSRKKRRK